MAKAVGHGLHFLNLTLDLRKMILGQPLDFSARPEAESCGVFGTGPQVETHIDAMRAVRNIKRIRIWGRDPKKAEILAGDQAQRTGLEVRATENPAEAAQADIICTLTGAHEPILKGEWVEPGTHVNLVGAHQPTHREADTALIKKALIIVDTREGAAREAGDLLLPQAEGAIAAGAVWGEVGELALGRCEGRTSAGQITVYKSLGVSAQDLFAASALLDRLAANES